jgi:hypothetical protein
LEIVPIDEGIQVYSTQNLSSQLAAASLTIEDLTRWPSAEKQPLGNSRGLGSDPLGGRLSAEIFIEESLAKSATDRTFSEVGQRSLVERLSTNGMLQDLDQVE